MSTLRTHFTFRVDTWTPDGESITSIRLDPLGASNGGREKFRMRLGEALPHSGSFPCFPLGLADLWGPIRRGVAPAWAVSIAM